MTIDLKLNGLLTLLTLALATITIIVIWLKGTIFASSRARLQRAYSYDSDLSFRQWLTNKFVDLMLCGICLTPWLVVILYFWSPKLLTDLLAVVGVAYWIQGNARLD